MMGKIRSDRFQRFDKKGTYGDMRKKTRIELETPPHCLHAEGGQATSTTREGLGGSWGPSP